MNVLIIDDEEFVRTLLQETLEAEGCRVTSVSRGQAGLDMLRTTSFDCVITDLRMPGIDGRAVLRWLRDHQPDVDVIVLTGHGEVAAAVEAMKAGAWDFLVKDIPFDGSQVRAALEKLRAIRSLRRENLALRLSAYPRASSEIIPGASTAWKKLMEMVEKVASSNAPVLLQGETGSGKEVVARMLHAQSPRRGAPFLAINCGAITGPLLESELFGHEKGAFTDAGAAKIGLITAAERGTVFLDEIGEMSGPMQVSLLRVLDRGEYRPVGGTRTLLADVRFVAASNRNLQDLVLAGKFRDDLLYRINTITITVPALRERTDDITGLAEHFLRTSHFSGTRLRSFSRATLARLSEYPWPGNVRELRNVVERLMLLSSLEASDTIGEDELASVLHSTAASGEGAAATDPRHETLECVEKVHILKVLAKHHGNKTQTARALDIDYKTLIAKLRKYGVDG